ncbi:MAG: AI-2E family transporter [Patescibacteria group bacterium]
MQRSKSESSNIWLFGIFIVAAVIVLYFLKSVVAIVVFALLLAALVDPVVMKLAKWRIPKWLSVVFVYIGLILLSSGIVVLIIPTLVEQTKEVLTTYAPYIEQAAGNGVNISGVLSGDLFKQDFDVIVTSFQDSGLIDAAPELISIISDVFGGLITLLLIFILAFYFVVEEKTLLSGLESGLPKKYKLFTEELLPVWRLKVGAWVRGQLLIMFMIFILTYLAFTAIGMPYALVLAIIAGLLEIVPFIGPILTAIFAVAIALSVSPLTALLAAVFCFVIQQIEAEFLTPKIMQKVVGLNPVIVIVAILVGFEIGGVVGAMLAIPVTMSLAVFVKEWTLLQKKN